MNRTPGLLAATMRGSRWGLPWLIMLALSASIAYAVIVSTATAPPAIDAPPAVLATQPGEQTPMAVERTGSAMNFTAFTEETRCQAHLGGGNPTPTNDPEMTAPPAWCRQH
jgi:hypothetical protein